MFKCDERFISCRSNSLLITDVDVDKKSRKVLSNEMLSLSLQSVNVINYFVREKGMKQSQVKG